MHTEINLKYTIMRRGYIASPKLQAQIDAFNAKDILPGDKVQIEGKYLIYSTSRDKSIKQKCVVKEVKDDTVIVYNGYRKGDTCEVSKENCSKDIYLIGANPFVEEEWHRRVRAFSFSLEGIIIRLIKEEDIELTTKKGHKYVAKCLNWNPYVYNKNGEKEYYQRNLCWSLKDKQLFIDSIYNRVNCGQILVRQKSFYWMDEEAEKGNDVVYEWDIVDGKQRLHTILEFINNEFPDSYGNYWNDLSEYSRIQFEDSHCLTYAEMEENTTDEDTIKAFLSVNFLGVPMSKEHIDYVKEINKKM